MNPIAHVTHFIYLLQLENYQLSRFWRAAVSQMFRVPTTHKKDIVWTKKLVLVTGLASLGLVVAVALVTVKISALAPLPLLAQVVTGTTVVLGFIIGFYLFFVLLSIATLVVWPVDRVIRWWIVRNAKQKLARLPEVIVVGITGSYGKTTMKQTLQTMLGGSLAVLSTPESYNTPVSVARFINNQVTEETDVVIVEMGAYGRGDIAALCHIARPDIAILTGINEAHLERFGSLENTTQAKFEIVEYARESAHVVLNADDERVVSHYEDFVGDQQTTHFFSSKNDERSAYKYKEKKFHQDGSGISFRLARRDADEEEEIGYIKVAHLGGYITGNVIAGFVVGDILNTFDKPPLKVSQGDLVRASFKITPASHRLEPVKRSFKNVLIIDDAYNGNPAGAQAAIEVLDNFLDRRKVYVTPGFVEIGKNTQVVHKELGKRLADVADVVVLMENSVLEYIEDGLRTAGFEGDLSVVREGETLQGTLQRIAKPHDVVLIQNDWPENYE